MYSEINVKVGKSGTMPGRTLPLVESQAISAVMSPPITAFTNMLIWIPCSL
jgi:hypothetical protein